MIGSNAELHFRPPVFFTPRGDALVGAMAHKVRVWNVDSLRPRFDIHGQLIGLARDGQTVLVRQKNGALVAWDLQTGKSRTPDPVAYDADQRMSFTTRENDDVEYPFTLLIARDVFDAAQVKEIRLPGVQCGPLNRHPLAPYVSVKTEMEGFGFEAAGLDYVFLPGGKIADALPSGEPMALYRQTDAVTVAVQPCPSSHKFFVLTLADNPAHVAKIYARSMAEIPMGDWQHPDIHASAALSRGGAQDDAQIAVIAYQPQAKPQTEVRVVALATGQITRALTLPSVATVLDVHPMGAYAVYSLRSYGGDMYTLFLWDLHTGKTVSFFKQLAFSHWLSAFNE